MKKKIALALAAFMMTGALAACGSGNKAPAASSGAASGSESATPTIDAIREKGVDERLIHATASHGWGITVDVAPEHEMEKVLFACDELTGLIGAAALMRPSKSVQDMELKSLKKKFKDKKFAAGCSREVIAKGAQMLGWELDELLAKTLEAMRADEARVQEVCG